MNYAESRSILYVAAFSLVLVAVCYANSLANDFILDDHQIIATNPVIRTIAPVRDLLTPYWGEKSQSGIYRPLTIFSLSVDYSIWKTRPGGYRMLNLILHALNGVLIFLLARGITGSTPAGWATTAIYLIHPVHTEAVVGIVGRSELLSAVLFFSSWVLFRQRRTWLSAAALFLSLLSKESAITFPAVMALDIWFSEGSFRKVLLEWKRFAAIAASEVAYLSLRLWVLGSLTIPVSAQYLGGHWTLVQRELTSGRAFLKYFQLLLAPVELAGNYDFNAIPVANARNWDAWAALLLAGVLILAALHFARRQSVIGFGVLFFFVAILPVSNWILPTSVVVAERFLYLPSFGFAIIVGSLWARLSDVRIRRLAAFGVIPAAVLLCVSHNYVWRNELSFFGHMVQVVPNNITGRQGYGVALLNARHFPEARTQFLEGLRFARNAPLLVGLASTELSIEQNCRNARPLLEEAARLERDPYANWMLAQCFDNEGDLTKAEKAYREAVSDSQFPEPRLLIQWGQFLERTGRPAEASAAYHTAAVMDPSYSPPK
jgi:tetratricopeptide (TPR) repeat protein